MFSELFDSFLHNFYEKIYLTGIADTRCRRSPYGSDPGRRRPPNNEAVMRWIGDVQEAARIKQTIGGELTKISGVAGNSKMRSRRCKARFKSGVPKNESHDSVEGRQSLRHGTGVNNNRTKA